MPKKVAGISESNSNNLSVGVIPADELLENQEGFCAYTNEENLDFELLDSETLKNRRKKPNIYTSLIENNLETVITAFGRSMSDSVVIKGVTSCGKSTLLDFFAEEIFTHKLACTTKLEGSAVIQIYPEYMPQDNEGIIDYFSRIIQRVNSESVIFVLDELYLFPTAFLTEFGSILYMLKQAFKKKNLKFLSTINEYIYQNVQNNGWEILSNSFTISIIPEMTANGIIKILEPRIKELSEDHECYFKDIPWSYEYAWTIFASRASFDSEDAPYNYEAFLHFIDGVLGAAKMKNQNTVSYAEIRVAEMSSWNCYLSFSEKQRKNNAKHEVGHAVIAIMNPDIFSVDGICCIPNSVSKVAGVTLVKELAGSHTEDSIIRVIAFYIAGRISQGKPYSTSAVGDLTRANQLAMDFAMQSGIYESIGYFTCVDKQGIISEEKLRLCEKQTESLLIRAEAYAKKVLKENSKLVDKMVKKLLKDPVLTKSAINGIMSDFNKKK